MSEERNTAVAMVETIKEPVKEDHLVLADVVKTKAQARALKDLIAMFKTCRPHDTKATLDFAKTWLKPLGAKMDTRGNWLLTIGDSKVVWSSHIDTVDWKEGAKIVVLNSATGVLRLSSKTRKASCLGADCTTGVWLMREMALAKVPGLYIWHEAEEAGGQGSSHIAAKTPHLLKDKIAAIAFDRKGFADVITEQMNGQCCSDVFAKALAKQLPQTGFKPDPTGSFTDTANYTDLIPECTNLSVGYFAQHGKNETQNVIFAMMMREAMIRFDEAKLVIKRKPGEGKRTYPSYASLAYGGSDRYTDWGWDDRAYPTTTTTTSGVLWSSWVTTGDRVTILKGAAGRGAFLGDIGRSGRVTTVHLSPTRTVDVTLDNGDKIDRLPSIYVEKIKPVACVWRTGDKVRVRDTAPTRFRPGAIATLMSWVERQGKLTLDLKYDDTSAVAWGAPEEDVQFLRAATKAAPPKVAALPKAKAKGKTRCGGLCGGRCKGYCQSPEALAEARERLRGDAAERQALSIRDFVALYPDAVADLIEGWGMNLADLYAAYPDSL